jgi:hypothetical protein
MEWTVLTFDIFYSGKGGDVEQNRSDGGFMGAVGCQQCSRMDFHGRNIA